MKALVCPRDARPSLLPSLFHDMISIAAQVTSAGLREMRLPGILAVGMPIVVGLFFRLVGSFTSRPMLGAEVLVSFIMFGTLAGILMALFLDNVGGAWVCRWCCI